MYSIFVIPNGQINYNKSEPNQGQTDMQAGRQIDRQTHYFRQEN